MGNININIINSNINNYVVSLQQKNKPPYTASAKKESTDDLKNMREKYKNLDSHLQSNNSTNNLKNYVQNKDNNSNLSNNNLQKIKLIENIYNEDMGNSSNKNKGNMLI